MAFCKYCGKELNEGEICSCQAASTLEAKPQTEAVPDTEAETQNPKVTVNIPVPDKEMVAATSKKVLNSFKSIIKKPAAEGAAFVAKGNNTVSLCFILIQACLSAIFAMIVIGKINGLMELGGAFLRDYKFSVIKAFFITLLFSVLFSVLQILLFRVAALVIKVKTGWNQLLALAAVRSIALMPLILVGDILFLINPAVGICVFYGAGLLAVCFILSAIGGIGEINGDKSVYIVFVVTVIFMLISVYIASRAAVLYLPGSLRDIMDGNLLSILEQFI